jgi:hypothetical protein
MNDPSETSAESLSAESLSAESLSAESLSAESLGADAERAEERPWYARVKWCRPQFMYSSTLQNHLLCKILSPAAPPRREGERCVC